MALERFLIDKSAVVRLRHPVVAADWSPVVHSGRVHMCPATELEILHSAQNFAAYRVEKADLHALYRWEPLADDVGARALEIHEALARVGKHRAASIPDLLIAATAEASRLTLLHYDRDFDTIAEITKQPTRWVAPAGTV